MPDYTQWLSIFSTLLPKALWHCGWYFASLDDSELELRVTVWTIYAKFSWRLSCILIAWKRKTWYKFATLLNTQEGIGDVYEFLRSWCYRITLCFGLQCCARLMQSLRMTQCNWVWCGLYHCVAEIVNLVEHCCNREKIIITSEYRNCNVIIRSLTIQCNIITL